VRWANSGICVSGGTVNRLRTDHLRLEPLSEHGNASVPSPHCSDRLWGQPTSLGLKRPARDADHSPPSSAVAQLPDHNLNTSLGNGHKPSSDFSSSKYLTRRYLLQTWTMFHTHTSQLALTLSCIFQFVTFCSHLHVATHNTTRRI
jgi:hypothetical protein